MGSEGIPQEAHAGVRRWAVSHGVLWILGLVAASLALTAFTVYDQVFNRTGLAFLLDEQLRFHRWIIEGTSTDRRQCRVLTAHLR